MLLKEDIVTYLNILKKFCDLTLNQKNMNIVSRGSEKREIYVSSTEQIILHRRGWLWGYPWKILRIGEAI